MEIPIALICIVVLLVLGFWIIIRIIRKSRKKKKMINNPPQEILDELNGLEEEYERRKKEDGTTSPYKIIWEHTRRRYPYYSNETIRGTEQTTNTGELSPSSSGRQDVQVGVAESPDKDTGSSGESKPNRSRNFFSRFRRRKS